MSQRPGAFAIYLEPWHLDIFEFLDLKKNTGKEEQRARDLFFALWIPDLFMKRVETNQVRTWLAQKRSGRGGAGEQPWKELRKGCRAALPLVPFQDLPGRAAATLFENFATQVENGAGQLQWDTLLQGFILQEHGVFLDCWALLTLGFP